MKSRLYTKGKPDFFAVAVFVFLAASLTSGTYTASHASYLSLDYTSGKLSANISGAPLQNVLETLSAKSGISVFLDKSLKSKKISVEFQNLPLEKGIKKLVNPYSSAMIFGKRTTSQGRSDFYITTLKVFDSSNKVASYLLVGKKVPDQKAKVSISTEEDQRVVKPRRMAHVPEQIKDPAKAAAFHKKVSFSMLRTRVGQKMTELREHQKKMRYEEGQKRSQIHQLRQKLNTASESEVRKIQANISLLTADLRNSQIRNGDELKRLQREVDQLKHRVMQQDGS